MPVTLLGERSRGGLARPRGGCAVDAKAALRRYSRDFPDMRPSELARKVEAEHKGVTVTVQDVSGTLNKDKRRKKGWGKTLKTPPSRPTPWARTRSRPADARG